MKNDYIRDMEIYLENREIMRGKLNLSHFLLDRQISVY